MAHVQMKPVIVMVGTMESMLCQLRRQIRKARRVRKIYMMPINDILDFSLILLLNVR
jgi:hypothetical protein